MNRIKLHVRKGDNVEVISGNFKVHRGRCSKSLPAKQRVLIEGVRMIKRHLRKSQDRPQGTIAEREGPIHISNVKVLERGEKAGKGKGAKKKATKEKPEESEKRKGLGDGERILSGIQRARDARAAKTARVQERESRSRKSRRLSSTLRSARSPM